MQNCNFSDRFVSETGLKILILSAGMDADYVDDDEDYGYDPEVEDYDAAPPGPASLAKSQL